MLRAEIHSSCFQQFVAKHDNLISFVFVKLIGLADWLNKSRDVNSGFYETSLHTLVNVNLTFVLALAFPILFIGFEETNSIATEHLLRLQDLVTLQSSGSQRVNTMTSVIGLLVYSLRRSHSSL